MIYSFSVSNSLKSYIFKSCITVISLSFFFSSCKRSTGSEIKTIDNRSPLEEITISQIDTNDYSLFTSIIIDASPAEVWDVMTDFEKMPDWSSTLQKIENWKVEKRLMLSIK
ncbi:SRPBCC family protein [Jiulongibacter sp. NS-SX5]|uniref:SRPBCC family protein n=1 Tax=Jiulongibacter sp. NS-SX5 TaxID=3463854 RepID=UPI00405992EA